LNQPTIIGINRHGVDNVEGVAVGWRPHGSGRCAACPYDQAVFRKRAFCPSRPTPGSTRPPKGEAVAKTRCCFRPDSLCRHPPARKSPEDSPFISSPILAETKFRRLGYNGVVVTERIGRYDIVKTLGKGAMGVVYLARDPLIDRLIALKTLRLDVDTEFEEQFRERFLREARAAGRLNHRGIVTVYDVGEDPETGLVYIAMEYIEGQDLKARMQAEPPLRLDEIARIVAEIALALDYAHSMGVVHRDIKPANILMTPGGSPKVMDFGVARMESSNLTVEGQFIGTPNFMSPEQILGQPVDGRSDIFSLGVLLFKLLTGERPFPGSTMHEVTMKIVQEPPPLPSSLRPGLPTAFNPILLKCLAKKPEERFQRASELAQLLSALARALVSREEGDAARTGIIQPDFSTQVEGPTDSTRVIATADEKEKITPKKSRRSFLDMLQALPLPEFFSWEVSGSWSMLILVGWTLLLAIPITLLFFQRDTGPWPAPSAAAARAQHRAVRHCFEARRLLAAGDTLAAESAALKALHQAPGSEGIRALIASIRERMEEESHSKEAHLRAAALRDEGRSLYREGRYTEAIARLEASLKLEPDDEVTNNYLDLAKERAALRSRRRSRSKSTRVHTAPTRSSTAAAAPSKPGRQTDGLAHVALNYNSPLNSGLISITVDGEALTEIHFDFTKKGFLGIKKKGSGLVRKSLVLPSGHHKIGIFLTSPDLPRAARKVFECDFGVESHWNLRIDQPKIGSAPSFFLLPLRK